MDDGRQHRLHRKHRAGVVVHNEKTATMEISKHGNRTYPQRIIVPAHSASPPAPPANRAYPPQPPAYRQRITSTGWTLRSRTQLEKSSSNALLCISRICRLAYGHLQWSLRLPFVVAVDILKVFIDENTGRMAPAFFGGLDPHMMMTMIDIWRMPGTLSNACYAIVSRHRSFRRSSVFVVLQPDSCCWSGFRLRHQIIIGWEWHHHPWS